MKRFLRWWCLGASLHFFGAYHSYFSFLTDPANRQIYLWSRLDWLYGLTSILFLGLATAAAGLALERRFAGGSRSVDFQRLFLLYVIVTTWAFFANASLSDPLPWLKELLPRIGSASLLDFLEGGAKLALLAACGWAALRRPAALSRIAAASFLILSPTILIFFLQAAGYKSFRSSAGLLPPPSVAQGPRVFLILFDAWSYERTFEQGQPRSELPNLRRLSEQSLVLHSAFSPRTLTLESIPRLLALNPIGLVTQEHMARDHDMADVMKENLFLLARTFGFSSYIVGSHIPYPDWFRRDVVHASSVSHYKPLEPGPRLAHVLWMIGRDNLVLRISGLKPSFEKFHAESVAGFNLERVHAGTLAALAAAPPRSFGFIHYPIPHSPVAVPDRGGAAPGSGPSDQYFSMLKVVDRDVAEIRATLERADQWDDSLVIITTDHAVSVEGAPETAICHIPVFIKLPGQRSRLDSHVPFDTRRLRGVITAALRGGVAARALRDSPEIKRLLSGAREPVRTCGPLPYPPL